jgi:hypothetical protein
VVCKLYEIHMNRSPVSQKKSRNAYQQFYSRCLSIKILLGDTPREAAGISIKFEDAFESRNIKVTIITFFCKQQCR